MPHSLRQFALPLVAFGVGVGIAELAGAANLGTAFGVGQILFVLAVAAEIVFG